MNRFALPAVNASALKAVVAIVAVTVAVLFGIDRVDLMNQIQTLKAVNQELTTQNRGVQGADGDPGRAPTEEEIAAAVEEFCADGACVGERGATGSPGATGSTGATGAAGVSVGSVKCNGTSVSFYSTTGALIGSIKMVCII